MNAARTHSAAVAAVAILVYANALWNGFALDDVYIIANNTRVHDLSDLRAMWLTPYWPSYGEQLGLYRPLAIFLYAVQWAAGGGAPWVFHLVNVLLHAAVSVLLYLFVLRLLPALEGADATATPVAGSPPWAALFAGLVHAVHPVHTEVVANVVGQAELLAAAATIAACHLHATRPPAPGHRAGRLLGIATLYLVGMLVKESAIVLPALLLAIDAAQRRWRFEAAAIRNYLPGMVRPIVLLTLLAAGYLVLRVVVIGSVGGVHASPNLPFLEGEHRILSAFRAWPEYLRLLLFPADLSSDYAPAVILPVESLTPMAALGLALLCATAALALLTPVLPAAGFPAAWFIITILPVSNLMLPIGVVVAERLLYTPSMAIAFGVAALWRLLPRASANARRLAVAAGALAIIAAGARTVVRNPDWKNTDAVWDAIVRDHPESYRSHIINAARASEAGQHTLARRYLELAYRIWPDDAPMLSQLAEHALREGDFDLAVALYERARTVAPFVTTYDIGIAIAHLAADRPTLALPPLDRAHANGGNPKTIHALRAQALAQLGHWTRAAEAWAASLAAPGRSLSSFFALHARTLAMAGATRQAAVAADSAIARAENPDIHRLLLELRAAIGRGCYDGGASSDPQPAPAQLPSCDPLHAWGIVVPVLRPENAKELQNARLSARRGGVDSPVVDTIRR
jgi:protein O-mannosyl-transferase